MPLLFWDASALVKRYVAEVGRETVNALFSGLLRTDMATTPWGYAETFSILVRRLNGGILDYPSFRVAVSALQAEVIDSPDFGLLSIGESTVFASVAAIRKHNLNATDAAILTMLLEYRRAGPLQPSTLVVVSADQRLIRAAHMEALATLDPETISASDVPDYLANL